MSTNEGIQPLSNTAHLAPVDPNVRVPDNVRQAAEAADAAHKAMYSQSEPQPAPLPVPAPASEPQAQQEEPSPQPQAQQHPAPTAADQNVTAEEWRHRFLSMQGRFQASTRQIGAMEHQMQELGQELVRTQNLLAQGPAPAPYAQQINADHGNLITDADREGFGDELIDLARRAARDAVSPELQRLQQENERLTQRVQTTGKRELFSTLDGEVPTWRQINKLPAFINWLRLPNIYTGALRGNMLKAAVDGAEAPKVIALFKDFIAEATATGALLPAQADQQQENPAPRTPAVPLETFAAPGKARPASGDSQVPSEKPIYTRAQISKFYDDKRRGLYAGRDADVNAFEADLGAAQREGRIR